MPGKVANNVSSIIMETFYDSILMILIYDNLLFLLDIKKEDIPLTAYSVATSIDNEPIFDTIDKTKKTKKLSSFIKKLVGIKGRKHE